jgi:hypothetical protein
VVSANQRPYLWPYGVWRMVGPAVAGAAALHAHDSRTLLTFETLDAWLRPRQAPPLLLHPTSAAPLVERFTCGRLRC